MVATQNLRQDKSSTPTANTSSCNAGVLKMMDAVRIQDASLVPSFSMDTAAKAWADAQGGHDSSSSPYSTDSFVQFCRSKQGFRTFVAVQESKDQEPRILGWVHCQVWSGPVPIEVLQPQVFQIGTIWGLTTRLDHGDDAAAFVSKQLLQRAISHLQKSPLHCKTILAWAGDSLEYTLLQAGGFSKGNMLTMSLENSEVIAGEGLPSVISFSQCTDDGIVVNHWKKMWMDCGIPAAGLKKDMPQITRDFIQDARSSALDYASFVAKDAESATIVGSISCQRWNGVNHLQGSKSSNAKSTGTVWAVYVHPEYRRQGIATGLMKLALEHLQRIGCQDAILVAASAEGERVYRRLGFDHNRALVYDVVAPDSAKEQQQDEEEETRNPHDTKNDVATPSLSLLKDQLVDSGMIETRTDWFWKALETATTRQLLAVFGAKKENKKNNNKSLRILELVRAHQIQHGTYIDPQDNWFTKNIHRFGGGFDMKRLSNDEDRLASKFDRLAMHYDHWTVGNNSKVEEFIVESFDHYRFGNGRSGKQEEEEQQCSILDVACGIGLQGQVLRLCGFEGRLVGCDVSSKMVQRVMERGSYNHAFVANANHSLLLDPDSARVPNLDVDDNDDDDETYDVIICTGALELLNHDQALSNMKNQLKKNGQLWLSFQLTSSSTDHQNVAGLSQDAVVDLLASQQRLKILRSRVCPNAFYTPSPSKDGSLLPVPYLFVVVEPMM